MAELRTQTHAQLKVRRLGSALGGAVSGIRLDSPLDDSTVARIRDALEEHLILFFEDQMLSVVEQRDFAAYFGALYVHPFYQGAKEAPEIMILEHDAQHRANSDRWHADMTYLAAPPFGAVLYADIIPEYGGDTMWASMYRAYETLSEPMQRLVSGLRAVHSFAKNFTPARFAELGMDDRRERMYAENPPVSHPIARTNPRSGRKALFVNRDFTSHIEGLAARESEALLQFLYEHMAQPEFQIRRQWRPHTVALWDNRWTQHCALADYFPHHRRVRRATIAGDVPV